MSVREIRPRHGGDRLGTVAHSTSPKAKQRELTLLVVYGDVAGDARAVGVRVRTAEGGSRVLTLRPNAAVELAKGLLQNLPAVYLAADDELVGILKTAVADAEREAQAVVEALKRS
jgi:hypothetical protein